MFSGFPGLLVCISLKEGEVSPSAAGGPPPAPPGPPAVTTPLGYFGLEQCKAWIVLLMCDFLTQLHLCWPSFCFLFSPQVLQRNLLTAIFSLPSLALGAPGPASPARLLFGAVGRL